MLPSSLPPVRSAPRSRPEHPTRPGTSPLAHLRSPRLALLLGLAALALLFVSPPAAATPTWVAPDVYSQSLAHGNANKIIVGRANTLHAVYVSAGRLYYTTSADGQEWNEQLVDSTLGVVASAPSITVDSMNRVGIVWVANADANGLGLLRFSRRISNAWNTIGFTNAIGAEPASISQGTRVHVTWTNRTHVYYTSLLTNGVPDPRRTVEEIPPSPPTAQCPGTSFHLPAIALVSDPCKPAIVRVAYLFVSDQQNAGGVCTLPDTKIGPRVSQLDNGTQDWSVVYDAVQSSSQNPGTVEPIALSMSANFSSGSTVLAWSDVQNGVARTRLAMRQPAGWVTTSFDNAKHHVHVRASSGLSAPAAEFRLASGGTMTNPFFAATSYWRSASWTGATPTWDAPNLIDNNGSSTGRPQALVWKRCALGNLSKTNVGFEALFTAPPFAAVWIGTDYSSLTAPCPQPVVASATPCAQQPVAQLWSFTIGTGVDGPKGAIVDLNDFGVVSEVGVGWAVARAPNGKIARVTWSGGEALANSDTTLTLSAPPAAVSVVGEGFSLAVQNMGHLAEYDELAR